MTVFASWAARQPDKPALIDADTGATLCFGELERQARHNAHWLVSLGLQAGDNIALLLENRFELLVLGMAAP